MRIQTGQGTIPLATLLAIWSISAITSLPGLAVSPIMGQLDTIFPSVSHLEIQMLTSIPSLLIIPFVLLSGKLSEKKDKTLILAIGLAIFLFSGILYFFAKSMLALILISCLLGVGAGMVIPLSTGLIADFFVGSYRTKQLGISSSITNLSLVLATGLTGWLAEINWHLPFVVYLIPVFALVLSYYLRDNVLKQSNVNYIGAPNNTANDENEDMVPKGKQMNIPYLIGVMVLYFFICYAALVVVLNLPFILQTYKLSSSVSGTVISIFFLAIMLPGLFLYKILTVLKNMTVIYSLISLAIGLLLVSLTQNVALIIIGTIFVGFGYGIIQPLVYDKATRIARSNKAVLSLAFVMSV
ncbi:MAG: MFS transporter, partial [Bacteroidales bacterium]